MVLFVLVKKLMFVSDWAMSTAVFLHVQMMRLMAGWMSQEVNYNPGNVPDERGEEEDSAPTSTPSSSPSKAPGSPSKRLRLTKKKALVELTSVPYPFSTGLSLCLSFCLFLR